MKNQIFSKTLYDTIVASIDSDDGHPNIFMKRNTILFKQNNVERTLFKYVAAHNGDACFGLDIEKSKHNFCAVLIRSDFSNLTDDEKFVLQHPWFKSGRKKMKDQLGAFLLEEMMTSVLIDFYIRMNDTTQNIVMCFSKHSYVSKRNVHYQVKFDLDFNYIDVEFQAPFHNDRYQIEDLKKFTVENRIQAFYVLFNYYTDVDVKMALDEAISTNEVPFREYIKDTNLSDCYELVGMNKSC